MLQIMKLRTCLLFLILTFSISSAIANLGPKDLTFIGVGKANLEKVKIGVSPLVSTLKNFPLHH